MDKVQLLHLEGTAYLRQAVADLPLAPALDFLGQFPGMCAVLALPPALPFYGSKMEPGMAWQRSGTWGRATSRGGRPLLPPSLGGPFAGSATGGWLPEDERPWQYIRVFECGRASDSIRVQSLKESEPMFFQHWRKGNAGPKSGNKHSIAVRRPL